MKNKKGFTLAEILGVIVIIGLLLIISGPLIINRIRENKEETETAHNKLVYNAVEQLIDEESQKYPKGKSYCIEISELIKKGKLVRPVVNITTGENIENKSVLVKRSITGYTSFDIYEKDDCEKISNIGPIEFEFSPKLGTWTKETQITIIYPTQKVDKYTHTKQDGSIVNDTNKITNTNKKVTEKYTKNGQITAEITYGEIKIKEKRKITNVDNDKPIVTIAPKEKEWTKGLEIKVILEDKASGIGQNYIEYGWTAAKNEKPTTWTKMTIGQYQQGMKSKEIIIPKEVTQNLEGEKYFWINKVKDMVGNESEIEKTGPYNFDNKVPTIEIENENCNTDKVLIKFKDEGGSGLRRYSTSETEKDDETISWINLENKVTAELQISKTANKYYIYVQDKAGNIGKLEYNPYKEYTVTLNTNGGSVTSNSQKVQNYKTYASLPTPTKTGNAFIGWYTKQEEGDKIERTATVCLKENQTLYARWKKSILYGKYDMNGGTLSNEHGASIDAEGSIITIRGTAEQKLGEYGGKLAENGLLNYNNAEYVNIVKTGYTVKRNAEWKIGNKIYDQYTQYKISDLADISNGDKTITIKVNWQANSYKVKFDGNGNTGGSTANKTCTYDSDCTLTTNGYSKKGYTFTGWNTKKDGSGTKYTNGGKVKNLTSTNNGTVTIYAQWRKNVLYAKYDVNGGSLNSKHGSSISLQGSLIAVNGETTKKLGEYGGKTDETGLPNYNNEEYININPKSGYTTAESKKEWKAGGKTFNQNKQYNINDLADLSRGDKTVTFYIRWVKWNNCITKKCVNYVNGSCASYGSYVCTKWSGGTPYECGNRKCYNSKVKKPGCTISSCNTGNPGDSSCRYRCCTGSSKTCYTQRRCTSGYYPCVRYNQVCTRQECVSGWTE